MATTYRFEPYSRAEGTAVVSAISRDGEQIAITHCRRNGRSFTTKESGGSRVCSGAPKRRLFNRTYLVRDASGAVVCAVVSHAAWKQMIRFPDGREWTLSGPINEPEWQVADESGVPVMSSTPIPEEAGRWKATSAVVRCERPDLPPAVVIGIVELHRLAVRARPTQAQQEFGERTITGT